MSSRKEIDEIFEKPDSNHIEDDKITLTETRESLIKKKRQPRKPKQQLDINFEKEKEDFLKSICKSEEEPEKKKEIKEVKEVKVVENKERKLQLIENLKKAREQKKLNKQQPKQEEPKQIVKEVVKEVIKEDPEYLEWKKQKQAKQQEQPKQEVKTEPIKIQEVKPIPQIVQQPKLEYIQRCTFKKPLWAK